MVDIHQPDRNSLIQADEVVVVFVPGDSGFGTVLSPNLLRRAYLYGCDASTSDKSHSR